MYQLNVNNKYNFNITTVNKQLHVNDEAVVLDRTELGVNKTHVLYQNNSYNIEVVELNKEEKTATVKVNGNVYSLTIKDQFDQLLQQLGMDNLAVNKIQQIKAPMPAGIECFGNRRRGSEKGR